MTSLIDDCFNHHITQQPLLYTQNSKYKNNKLYKNQQKFKNFLSNLTQISPHQYILSLKSSQNSNNNTTYFTILTIQSSYINIKIFFIHASGNLIRNRQKFFINNQNHSIYSHQPFNLKTNPISGQLYVKYSYFYHNHIKIDMLWKDLYKKIENVEKQLEIIIGIKNKKSLIKEDQDFINDDYYYKNVNEQKNVQNIIYAVKMSEIVKENVNLQNQLLKQYNNTTYKNNIKSKKPNYSLHLYQQNTHYLITPHPPPFNISSNITHNIIQSYTSSLKQLQNSCINKTLSSINPLTLTKQDQFLIGQKLQNLKQNYSERIKLKQLNKELFLNFIKTNMNKYNNIKKIYGLLKRMDGEYRFLKTYYEYNNQHGNTLVGIYKAPSLQLHQSAQVHQFREPHHQNPLPANTRKQPSTNYSLPLQNLIITSFLKQQQFLQYIQKNILTISFNTTVHLIIQLLNSLQILWSFHNITLNLPLNLTKFIITKSLIIKIKQLQNVYYINPSRYQAKNNDLFAINAKKTQIVKHISKIIIKLIYKQNIFQKENKNNINQDKKSTNIIIQKYQYKNNSNNNNNSYNNSNSKQNQYQQIQQNYHQHQHQQNTLIFQSIHYLSKTNYPSQSTHLLLSLNYFFISAFFQHISSKKHQLQAKKFATLYKKYIQSKSLGKHQNKFQINQFQFQFNKIKYQEEQEKYKKMKIKAKQGVMRLDLILMLLLQRLCRNKREKNYQDNNKEKQIK